MVQSATAYAQSFGDFSLTSNVAAAPDKTADESWAHFSGRFATNAIDNGVRAVRDVALGTIDGVRGSVGHTLQLLPYVGNTNLVQSEAKHLEVFTSLPKRLTSMLITTLNPNGTTVTIDTAASTIGGPTPREGRGGKVLDMLFGAPQGTVYKTTHAAFQERLKTLQQDWAPDSGDGWAAWSGKHLATRAISVLSLPISVAARTFDTATGFVQLMNAGVRGFNDEKVNNIAAQSINIGGVVKDFFAAAEGFIYGS